jgi:catechol 2,3-dioxygenase-like lactoylglutathione lyase family enzyme
VPKRPLTEEVADVSQLNYMAIMCDDPVRLQEWYQRWFGFEEINRNPAGSVYISDGYFTMGLLKRGSAAGEDTQDRGLHHFGFQIDSIVEIERNLEDFDPSIRIEQRPESDPYAQYRIKDPEGVILDLSEKGYGSSGTQRVPGIRHLATFNRDQGRKFDFYRQVMDMRDATRTDAEVEAHLVKTAGHIPAGFQRSTSPFCGDGFINLAILGTRASVEPGARVWGFEHFGILAQNPLEIVKGLGQMAPDDRPADVRPPERQVEYGIRDPEGNRIDLSGEKGWKVDVDKWARVTA